jgi:hypothetical protein
MTRVVLLPLRCASSFAYLVYVEETPCGSTLRTCCLQRATAAPRAALYSLVALSNSVSLTGGESSVPPDDELKGGEAEETLMDDHDACAQRARDGVSARGLVPGPGMRLGPGGRSYPGFREGVAPRPVLSAGSTDRTRRD